MKRFVTVLTCDHCKVEDAPGMVSVFVQTGWESDPAGGPSQPEGESIELCPTCVIKALHWWQKRCEGFEASKAFLAMFSSQKFAWRKEA